MKKLRYAVVKRLHKDIQCQNLIENIMNSLLKVKQLAEEYWPKDTASMKNLSNTRRCKAMTAQFVYHTDVKSSWVDYNGHMNDAEYNRVFSDATDAWLAYIGLDQEGIQSLHYTILH